jgi:hypothetical protein
VSFRMAWLYRRTARSGVVTLSEQEKGGSEA